MKGDHDKHQQNSPMTIQLNNVYYKNMNVKSFTVINITQMMVGKQWVKLGYVQMSRWRMHKD